MKKSSKNDSSMSCSMSCGSGMCGSICTKCCGWSTLTLGALVLINVKWAIVSWPAFVGILLVVWGAKQAFMPGCNCCK